MNSYKNKMEDVPVEEEGQVSLEVPESCHALLAVRDIAFRGIYCFEDEALLRKAERLLRDSFLRNYRVFQEPQMASVQKLAVSYAGVRCFLPQEELQKDILRHAKRLRGESTHPFFLCLSQFRGMGYPTVRVIAGNRTFVLFLDDMYYYRFHPSYVIDDLVVPNPDPSMHPPLLTLFSMSNTGSVSVVEFWHMAKQAHEAFRKIYGSGVKELGFEEYVAHYASGSPAYHDGLPLFGRIQQSGLDSNMGSFLFLSSVTNSYGSVSNGETIELVPVEESSQLVAINLDDVRDITTVEIPGIIYDQDFRRELFMNPNLIG